MGSGIPKFTDKPTKILNGLLIEPLNFKKAIKLGDTIHFTVNITNEFAGHKIPTGDPERFIIIEQSIYTKDSILFDQVKHRIGEEWEWYPIAKKVSDNNLLPKEKRSFKFDFIMPEEKNLYYEIKVSKHRSTEENKTYNKLPLDYPISMDIFKEQYPINHTLH